MAPRQIYIGGVFPSRDANGRALPGLLRFYMAGSGGVPKPVFTDATLATPHEMPIQSDAGGRWPPIWADEDEIYDAAWTDQVFDANVRTFTNVQPVKDALAASADISNAAADAAIAAQAASELIAQKFGDMDAAIAAAQAAQEGSEEAAELASQALALAIEARDLAMQYRDEAKEYRDQAGEIAGFDPSTYVNTGTAQSFTDAAKKQARDNIAAQPVLGIMDREKVATPAIVAGTLTLDVAAASRFEVAWNANLTNIDIVNCPASDSTSWTLVLIHGAGGPFDFDPGPEFHWAGNFDPDLATNNGDRNFIVMTTVDGAWVDCFPAGFTRA